MYFACTASCKEASRDVKIPVTVPKIGNYMMEFYLLMLCDGANCEQAGTLASISIDGNQEVFSVAYNDNPTLSQRWVKFSARFNAESTKFNVNRIFQHKNSINKHHDLIN